MLPMRADEAIRTVYPQYRIEIAEGIGRNMAVSRGWD